MTAPASDEAEVSEGGEVASSPADTLDEQDQPARAGYGQDAVIGGSPAAGDGDGTDGETAADTEDGQTTVNAGDSQSEEPDGDDPDSDIVVAEVIDVLPDDDDDDADDDEEDEDEASGDDLAVSDQPEVTEGGWAATTFTPVDTDGTGDTNGTGAIDGAVDTDEAGTPDGPAATTTGGGEGYDMASLSPQWHDIQASFVDDPRAAVDMAAQAADAAVTDLVTALRERQSALVPAGDASQDTEQLRTLLREYRSFCQVLAEVQGKLPQQAA